MILYSLDRLIAHSSSIDFLATEENHCDTKSFVLVTKHLPHESAYNLNELWTGNECFLSH